MSSQTAVVLLRSLSAATLGGPLFATPADAQTYGRYVVTIDGREREVVLPRAVPDCQPAAGSGDEIVICARPREAERYRLPRPVWDPNGPVDSVSRERHQLYEQGDAGIGSCSTVGPGGWTGCALRGWKAAREQHGR